MVLRALGAGGHRIECEVGGAGVVVKNPRVARIYTGSGCMQAAMLGYELDICREKAIL